MKCPVCGRIDAPLSGHFHGVKARILSDQEIVAMQKCQNLHIDWSTPIKIEPK